MKRRGFLGSILACATPPGYVRAGVLMPLLVPRHTGPWPGYDEPLEPVLTPMRNEHFGMSDVYGRLGWIKVPQPDDFSLVLYGGGGGGGIG